LGAFLIFFYNFLKSFLVLYSLLDKISRAGDKVNGVSSELGDMGSY
jgi:hypothetical protein